LILKSFIICFFLTGFSSCNKPLPQLPANKGDKSDKNAVRLLAINETLAIKEDSILKEFVKSDSKFKKNETGFWFKIDYATNNDFLKVNEICKFNCKMFLINGKLIQEDEKQVVIGKKQVIVGLEEGLKILHKGESATFIIPWYLGYGMTGSEPNVPPYSSLILIVKLHD
jgi:FKBP-type peptidyl-prolyl cis-trans isomerase